jgi:hypothetical protein
MSDIIWTTSDQWDYDTYSLNTRLHVMAGNQSVVDGLTTQCREKFGRDPDTTPRFDDRVYFRDTFGKRRK